MRRQNVVGFFHFLDVGLRVFQKIQHKLPAYTDDLLFKSGF